MVKRQGGGNAAGVIRVTPAANYPATYTEQRIISMRKANPREGRKYAQAQANS